MSTTKYHAYCWASGRIEFGETIPEGALPCAMPVPMAQKQLLEDTVLVVARHGYTPGYYIVPGIPECEDDSKAIHLLRAFRHQVDRRLKLAMAGGVA
jgi:hypothetical protein